MDKLAVDVAGVHLAWPMLLAGVAAAQFVIVALVSVVAPVKMKWNLAISTAVFFAGWFFAFDGMSLLGSKNEASQASAAAASVHQGTCASVREDMPAGDVRAKLGPPDEVRNDDGVRGPGSTVLIYRDIRCAVHLFDDRVELVD